jgi:hypothetical protein
MAEMPVPQCAEAKLFEGHPRREGWEGVIAWFYPTSFILICAVLAFEPETGIDAWAKKEAIARLAMKEAGFTDFTFGKHYQSLSDDELKTEWDIFTKKALRMTDDDDDDDEEEEDEDDDDDE